MRPLDLDYSRSGRRSHLAVWLLSAFAVGFAVDTASRYRQALEDLHGAELRIAKATASKGSVAVAQPSATAEELKTARDTARRIALPWNSLFHALETAKSDSVALLAIEPDAESRTVVLAAEAKDYSAVLAYVAALSQQKEMDRVHLSHHEVKTGSSPRPITFTVSASWKGNA